MTAARSIASVKESASHRGNQEGGFSMRVRLLAPLALILLVAAAPVTVPVGTHVHFKILRTLNTNTAKAGQSVPAELTESIVVDGRTVAKSGSPAVARITEAEGSGRIGGSAKLSLRLASITLANGQS